jgi:hypothetical protein
MPIRSPDCKGGRYRCRASHAASLKKTTRLHDSSPAMRTGAPGIKQGASHYRRKNCAMTRLAEIKGAFSRPAVVFRDNIIIF